MTADRILVTGVRAVGVHGALPEERARAQPFEVDVELHVDLGVAGDSDRLEDTVEYGAVAEAVARVVQNESYALLERLATRIADMCLADARVQGATVTVRKLRPPVPVELDSVAVRIER